jgi:hypothetical protein
MRRLAFGAVGGFVLGVIARAWMRFIADEPEFTWSGTLMIVLGFTIFGSSQAAVSVARRRRNAGAAVFAMRALGAAGMLPLLVGAGALMLPTVVGGGLVKERLHWSRGARLVCALVAAVPLVLVARGLVDTFGWSLHAALGFVLMLAIYGVIVRATTATFAPQTTSARTRRRLRVAGSSAAVLALLAMLALGGVR